MYTQGPARKVDDSASIGVKSFWNGMLFYAMNANCLAHIFSEFSSAIGFLIFWNLVGCIYPGHLCYSQICVFFT
jgi:hypothetical protein